MLGYPSLYLYQYVYLVQAMQDRLHPFDHCLLQPGLCLRRLVCITLDNHLVVADKCGDGLGALTSSLP
jgi:hypothetical protein